MPDQLKAGVTEQVLDISLIAGEKIVDAENIVIGRNQAIAKMRSKKAGTAGY
jgi:hypothetical protein